MNILERYLQRIWRASLSPHALLTLDELRELLPGRSNETEFWVLEHVGEAGVVAGTPIYRWSDVLAAMELDASKKSPIELSNSDNKPVASWQEAAAVCGVSPHTLRRRREEFGDRTEPWWATDEECRAWYRSLVSGPVPSARKRPSQQPPAKKGLTLADRPQRRGKK